MRQTLRNDQLSAADLGFLQIILGLCAFTLLICAKTCQNGLAQRNEINMKESWMGVNGLRCEP